VVVVDEVPCAMVAVSVTSVKRDLIVLNVIVACYRKTEGGRARLMVAFDRFKPFDRTENHCSISDEMLLSERLQYSLPMADNSS